MAILRRKSDGLSVPVSSACLIGRGGAATLRIDDPTGSSEHARLKWRAPVWTLRDLASRNGTFVNGERLPSGVARDLSQGDEIAFGNRTNPWILEDAGAPGPIARNVTTAALRGAAHGMLTLPDDATPSAVVLEDAEGRYVIEIDGEARPLRDGDAFEIAGESWAISLPAQAASTWEVSDAPLALATSELRLTVSRDEEQVEVALLSGGRAHALPPRAHYYLLLTLARLRIEADRDATLLPHERGWASVDDLCRMLGVEEIKLNVEVYRARRDLAELGVVDAAAIIERRRGLRTLRIGAPRVTVVQAP